jgi:UDP-N-acetylmuramoyl-tripeptide--D-alanyl-D-alanine ligase
MRFTLAEVAEATNGRCSAESSGVVIQRAHTDSRQCGAGDLFVAVKAERDGHDFIDAAISAGVVGWLTEHPDDRPGAVRVHDTEAALTALGVAARTRVAEPVIGITGSSGKTSTKDLIAAILLNRGPTGFSEKSFNNELGVPLTLVNAPDDAWASVIEMGARGIGHIAALCAVARPTVGVVTNVGTAHLAMYDRPDGIVIAKGELVEALPSNGVAVLNFDDASRDAHAARTSARVLTFSAPTTGAPSSSRADVTVDRVVLDGELRPSFNLITPWGRTSVRVGARGRHQVANAAAAAAATLAGGSTLDDVVQGLSTEVLSPWRMEFVRLASGAVILNDAYNANDQSMAAALRSLVELPAARRIAVLGTMAELGAHAPVAHRSTIELARSLSIDVVIAIGEPLYVGADHLVDDRHAARRLLIDLGLSDGDAVLVKASRVAGLEQLVVELEGGEQA